MISKRRSRRYIPRKQVVYFPVTGVNPPSIPPIVITFLRAGDLETSLVPVGSLLRAGPSTIISGTANGNSILYISSPGTGLFWTISFVNTSPNTSFTVPSGAYYTANPHSKVGTNEGGSLWADRTWLVFRVFDHNQTDNTQSSMQLNRSYVTFDPPLDFS